MADSRSITRRLFMRHGAAAGAAVSTVAFAATTAQAAKVSRLSEVTAAFERARKTFHRAIEVEEAAELAWKAADRKQPILGPKINGGMVEVRGRDRDEAYDDQEKAISQFGHKLRRELTSIGADTSVVDAWELRMTEEAIAAVEKWQARRDDCGYTAASEALTAAMDGEIDALLAVLAYRPVSQEDARNKALWIIQRQGRHEISGVHGAFEALVESLLPDGEELHEQDNGEWSLVGKAVS